MTLSSEYEVGSFDGRQFTAERAKLPGQRGDGFYAAQTFSDIPAVDGRRIQTGWLRGLRVLPGKRNVPVICEKWNHCCKTR